MLDKNVVSANCLTGSLLVSAPGRNPHSLSECVIFVYEHSPQLGAQGIVINRKSGLTVNALLERMNYVVADTVLTSPLYHGGMQDENGIVMLHSSDWYSSNTRPVTGEFSVSSDTFMLEKLVSGNEPDNWLMCAGKCSWKPGELDKEANSRDWLSTTAVPELVFSAQTDSQQWQTALEHCAKQAVDSWF